MSITKSEHLGSACKALANGGIIAIPTDTVYGLAADAYNPEAIEKIYAFKNRGADKHLILQVHSTDQLFDLVDSSHLSDTSLQLLQKYWPGEITFIFKKKQFLRLPCQSNTIGIRIPNHRLTLDVLRLYGKALVVTSLNQSGERPICRHLDIPQLLVRKLDYVIPWEQELSNVPSTIVDLSGETPTVLRQGHVFFFTSLIGQHPL
ncbi:MAG: L-threonylcarbamoyladenylate synthase [Candidatus Margulisiibacteriota bacterium]